MLKQNSKGFTLIELLVTISIMVTLSSIFLLNYSDLGKKRAVGIARNNIISDLRKMQGMSLSSRDVSPGVLAGDYGLSFTTSAPSTYTLISDSNQGARQAPIATNYLPTNIQLTSMRVQRVDGTVIAATNLEILYKATYGRTLATYSGGGSSGIKETDDQISLTFTSTVDGSITTTIVVNGTTGNINQ
jgi:prepilin-type N-terminal cleavage/methylation domain-containing protein